MLTKGGATAVTSLGSRAPLSKRESVEQIRIQKQIEREEKESQVRLEEAAKLDDLQA